MGCTIPQHCRNTCNTNLDLTRFTTFSRRIIAIKSSTYPRKNSSWILIKTLLSSIDLVRGQTRIDLQTHIGSTLGKLWPWPLTFWPQSQCMQRVCRGVYCIVFIDVDVDSSSRLAFRARTDRQTDRHTHTADIPTHASAITGMGKNKTSLDNRLRSWCRILMNSAKHCSCLVSNSYRHLANSF